MDLDEEQRMFLAGACATQARTLAAMADARCQTAPGFAAVFQKQAADMRDLGKLIETADVVSITHHEDTKVPA